MSRTAPPPNRRPRLLVSVRDVGEAQAALDGGADLVDVKEPTRGPLGRADDAVVEAIVQAVRSRSTNVTTSAALGELLTDDTGDESYAPCPDLVKVGLAGAAAGDWGTALAEWRDRVVSSSNTGGREWVGVVYADWRAASAPPPREVVEASVELDCAGVLFDTYDKCSGTLFEAMPGPEILELVEAVHAQGRFLALAGRLGLADLPRLEAFRPDVVAVRSAACEGGDRQSVVTTAAVRRLRTALDHWGDSRDPSPAETVLPDATRG